MPPTTSDRAELAFLGAFRSNEVYNRMPNPFATTSMAEGYARSRPPLHPIIVGRAGELAGLERRVPLALRLGCGAGLSTRPLHDLAGLLIRIQPAPHMLSPGPSVAPGAFFFFRRRQAPPPPSPSVGAL